MHFRQYSSRLRLNFLRRIDSNVSAKCVVDTKITWGGLAYEQGFNAEYLKTLLLTEMEEDGVRIRIFRVICLPLLTDTEVHKTVLVHTRPLNSQRPIL